jgi:hypothetical protein
MPGRGPSWTAPDRENFDGSRRPNPSRWSVATAVGWSLRGRRHAATDDDQPGAANHIRVRHHA